MIIYSYHNKSMPIIDVIIPVYNGARFLNEAVLSAVHQTLAPSRIIICDDGSTDETSVISHELSSKYHNVEYILLAHGGEASARNWGIKFSTAEYVAFLDADDVWMPTKLQMQIALIRRSGGTTSVVHSEYYFIDEESNTIPDRYIFKPHKSGFIFWDLLVGDYAVSGSASAVIVRRDVLKKVGFFDQRLFHGADADMWLRLAYISHFDFVPKPLVALRIHSSSAQNKKRNDREFDFFLQQLIYYEKWRYLACDNPEFIATLRKRALQASLPYIFRLPKIEYFYKLICNNDKSISHHGLFKNRIDFYFSLLNTSVKYIIWRLRRSCFNDTTRFLG